MRVKINGLFIQNLILLGSQIGIYDVLIHCSHPSTNITHQLPEELRELLIIEIVGI